MHHARALTLRVALTSSILLIAGSLLYERAQSVGAVATQSSRLERPSVDGNAACLFDPTRVLTFEFMVHPKDVERMRAEADETRAECPDLETDAETVDALGAGFTGVDGWSFVDFRPKRETSLRVHS